MLKSKIYPKSKHRLGRSPRVKIEDEKLKNADVAELADALVSGSSEAIHVGSSPVVRTNQRGYALAVYPFLICGLSGEEPTPEADEDISFFIAFAEGRVCRFA